MVQSYRSSIVNWLVSFNPFGYAMNDGS